MLRIAGENALGTITEPLTLDAYAALRQADDRYVTELVRGIVVREPRPGRLHGRTQVRLGHLLQSWADAYGDAEVTAGSGYVLADDPATVRGPDVAVVLSPAPEGSRVGGWTRGAPDVAIEVLSPHDTSSAMQRKTLEYLEAGARLVWIVDPGARTVTLYRPDGTARVLREDDTLEGGDVLPDFGVRVGELFR